LAQKEVEREDARFRAEQDTKFSDSQSASAPLLEAVDNLVFVMDQDKCSSVEGSCRFPVFDFC
jgi:hypothetical protein